MTELSVGRLAVGHPAEVRIDAFPDLVLSGKIAQIGLESELHQGDVTYPVTVALEGEVPSGLRWGMTALIRVRIP